MHCRIIFQSPTDRIERVPLPLLATVIGLFALAAVTPSCGESVAVARHAEVTERARTNYRLRCAACHGETGNGEGPVSATLGEKAPNWTDVSWQSSVSDDESRRVIVQGGSSSGKNSTMPAYPDLAENPREFAELVDLIRSFGS